MSTVKEIGAYLGLALLALSVLCAGIATAHVVGGFLGLFAGTAAAAGTFQALRRVTGRVVGAAVESA
jgi:hypothetical protein